MPKGMECPKAINPVFVLSYDAFDEEKFTSLPDFIKDKIKSSDEYKAMIEPAEQETEANIFAKKNEQFEKNGAATSFTEPVKEEKPSIEGSKQEAEELDPPF